MGEGRLMGVLRSEAHCKLPVLGRHSLEAGHQRELGVKANVLDKPVKILGKNRSGCYNHQPFNRGN